MAIGNHYEWTETRTIIRLVLHRRLRIEVQHPAYDIPMAPKINQPIPGV